MRRIFPALLLLVMTGQSAINAGETWAEKLGYAADKRVLILHANYMGSAYEFNRPGQELLQAGVVQSAGVMVTCPWFEEFAQWHRQHPVHDIGICLTLNSPGSGFRWGPIGGGEETSTLVDADGYLWRSPIQFALRADAEQVRAEIDRQIRKAREGGIRPSHLLPFMGSLFARADLLQLYLQAAEQYWIPAVIVELTPENVALFRDEGFPITEEMIHIVGRYPLPKLDHVHNVPDAASYASKRDRFYELIKGLAPGLTQIIVGPADKTPAIEQITPNWQNRVWEARLLADAEVHKFLEDEGIVLTNWREIMRRFENGPISKEVPETSSVEQSSGALAEDGPSVDTLSSETHRNDAQ